MLTRFRPNCFKGILDEKRSRIPDIRTISTIFVGNTALITAENVLNKIKIQSKPKFLLIWALRFRKNGQWSQNQSVVKWIEGLLLK